MGLLRLIFCVLSIVIRLDSLHENKISSRTTRNKRECQSPFSCESEPSSTQLPWIPGRTNCVLPEYPDNGKWSIFAGPKKFPGQIVPAKTILQYECDPKYKLRPDAEFSICYKFWSESPICLKTCPSIRSSQLMQMSCEMDNKETLCIDPYEGSRARVLCARSYYNPHSTSRPFLNCINGTWDATAECIPAFTSHGSSNLTTGNSKCTSQLLDLYDESIVSANLGEFPYMAVVGFRRDSNIFFLCSGALITASYVITSGYCAKISGVGTPEVIRVGTFNHNSDEPTAQDGEIKEVKVHPKFQLPSRDDNLALIKVEKPFTLNNFVQPISIIASDITDNRGIVLNWIWQHMDTYYLNATLIRTTGAIISPDICNSSSGWAWTRMLSSGFDETKQLCMRRPRLLRSTASNGMFVTQDKDKPCTHRLIGISSIGMYLQDKYPEVYQKLYPYLEWINGIIGSDASKN